MIRQLQTGLSAAAESENTRTRVALMDVEVHTNSRKLAEEMPAAIEKLLSCSRLHDMSRLAPVISKR